MTTLIAAIRRELKKNSSDKTKKTTQTFFKEEIKTYGVKSAVVGKICKESFKTIKHKTKSEIFALCEELLKSGYVEEAGIAYTWSHYIHKDYEPKDFQVFEKWVNKHVSNWAECDTLCNHTIGTFIEKFPQFIKQLKLWTKSKNRWTKRASAVSLILPARKGMFLKDIFEIADTLLLDADDMVQKGYGWLLKEASRQHQKEVFDYVVKHKKVMPRIVLRYAIEKMPENLRKKAMVK